MKNSVTDLVVYSMVVAGIYVLTANKNGTSLVSALFSGYSGVVKSVEGRS